MFAVALVPANGLTVIHAHDDHHDGHEEHDPGLSGLSQPYHVTGAHDAEDLHAHRVGWSQIQRSTVVREISAPVLVAQIWLNALTPELPAQRFVGFPLRSAESEMVHAPPPLLRSMAFLI